MDDKDQKEDSLNNPNIALSALPERSSVPSPTNYNRLKF